MKKALLLIIFLISLVSYAQNYDEKWKIVTDYEKDGRVKSAAEEVDKIYTLAKKDRNEPQIIKTFFYKSRYMLILEEDAQNKVIKNLKKEKQSLSEPSKALLESLYAQILNDVYRKKQYDLAKRTVVNKTTPKDFNLWTTKDFMYEIKRAYQRSLKKREILYNTPLEKYEAVVELNLLLLKTNRSLYDFLAERYIEPELYSYNSISGDQTNLLLMDTPEFLKFKVKDSTNALESRIALMQEMEQYYMAKKDTNSLQRSVLRRLEFSYQHVNQKDETYFATLIEISNNWKNSPFLYDAKLMLARRYYGLANKTKNHDYNIKALALCNEIIEQSGNSGTLEALQLKNRIINHRISVFVDKHPVSNEPILARVVYKNIDSVNIAIYKIPRSQHKDITTSYYNSVEFIKQNKPHISQVCSLPLKNDFFEYETEIIIPALESGLYLIAVKPLNKSAEPDKEYGFTTLEASQITLVKQEAATDATYQVVDRISGMPVKGAKINIKDKSYSTGKNGTIHFTYPTPQKDYVAEVTAIYKKDTLSTTLAHRYYQYSDSSTDKEEFTAGCQLYLDRAIYRPGQTAFFKGIVTQNKNGITNVAPNIYITVTIFGANNDEIKTFRLKTNEFGSFTGQFDIPKNALTGQFRIIAEEDEDPESDENYDIKKDEHPFWDNVAFRDRYLYFEVEEYKRPTFEVKFDPITKIIPLNEKVSVKGTAKAFSAASISGAKVEYIVSCESRYTNREDNYYGYEDSSDISEGETLTDADGNFSVDFITTPSPEFSIDDLPLFTYKIEVTVTDINGETHEQRFEVNAGYHSLGLSASLPSIVKPENENTVSLFTQNLNGGSLAAMGEIKIYKLSEPKKENSLRKRPWPSPEIQAIPEDIFKKNFPYYPYADLETDIPTRERLVFSQKVNTADIDEIALKDFSGWESGEYELIFAAHDSTLNKPIETTRKFVFEKDDTLFKSKQFGYRIVNKNYVKDGYAEIEMHTAVKKLFVSIQAFYDDNMIYDKYVVLENGIKTIKIPVSKNVLEDMPVAFNYVWQNEYYNDSEYLEIEKKPEEKLEIVTASIKNKIQPGSNETWSFTIKGNTKEVSEVLASMYDASLDQFTTEKWYPLSVEKYHGRSGITSKYAYLSNNAFFKIDNPLPSRTYTRFNDRLISFNMNTENIVFVPVIKNNVSEKEILTKGGFITIGVVSDDTGPLPGASVFIKGTERSTQTDIDGKFSIAVLTGEILEISFVGYYSESVTVGTANSIPQITLEAGGVVLESVVIDKYRSTISKTTTAAVTTMSIEVIEDRANASILQSLQGQVAGLNITHGSGQPGSDSTIILRGVGTVNGNADPLFVIDGVPVDENGFRSIHQSEIASFTVLKDAAATSVYGNRGANGVIVITTKKGLEQEKEDLKKVQGRKNFNETAFFYPQLQTDKEGNLSFTFTSPEALTEWKLRLFAHNKRAVSGYLEDMVITQKDFMIVPNMPRFLREKDTIVIMAKINNMTPQSKTGNAMLMLFDAATMQPIDSLSMNSDNMKPFTLESKGNTTVSWKIRVPESVEGIQYKVLAKSGTYTDGEENILPVLSNRMLITESLPVWVPENTTKEYTIENLKNNTSSTLKSHRLTFEYTSNPAWMALQSLPYLMEYEYDCSEQVFSRQCYCYACG